MAKKPPSPKPLQRISLVMLATDKDIHDVIMASPQRYRNPVLLDLAAKRGLFYAPCDSREQLAENLSLLTYDFDGLSALMVHNDTHHRTENSTTITLKVDASSAELKDVIEAYQSEIKGDEKIALRESQGKLVATIHYTELDFGKTPLLQRRKRDAEVEFDISGKETVIRLPANERAKAVVDAIKEKLEKKTSKPIDTKAIELDHLKTPAARTEFLTSLIAEIPDHSLRNVTKIKVDSKISQSGAALLESTLDVTEKQRAEKALMAVVEDVALRGQSLLSSSEYIELWKKGFFITSIRWTALHTQPMNELVEFEANFDDPQGGKAFKYTVRGIYRRLDTGLHTRYMDSVPPEDRGRLLTLLEKTARSLLSKVKDK